MIFAKFIDEGIRFIECPDLPIYNSKQNGVWNEEIQDQWLTVANHNFNDAKAIMLVSYANKEYDKITQFILSKKEDSLSHRRGISSILGLFYKLDGFVLTSKQIPLKECRFPTVFDPNYNSGMGIVAILSGHGIEVMMEHLPKDYLLLG